MDYAAKKETKTNSTGYQPLKPAEEEANGGVPDDGTRQLLDDGGGGGDGGHGQSDITHHNGRSVRTFRVTEGSISMDTDIPYSTDDARDPGKERCSVQRALKKIYKLLKSLVGLVFVLLAYTFFGAWIFMTIEKPVEDAQKTSALDQVLHERQMVTDVLKNSTRDLQAGLLNETEWERRVQAALLDFEQVIVDVGPTTDTKPKWTFFGSVLFCVTTYTTIGYGNIAPATKAGRIATMLYATVGIPIVLIVLADLGRRLTVGLKYLWSFIRRYYYTGYCRKVRKRGRGSYDMGESHAGGRDPGGQSRTKYTHESETGGRKKSGAQPQVNGVHKQGSREGSKDRERREGSRDSVGKRGGSEERSERAGSKERGQGLDSKQRSQSMGSKVRDDRGDSKERVEGVDSKESSKIGEQKDLAPKVALSGQPLARDSSAETDSVGHNGGDGVFTNGDVEKEKKGEDEVDGLRRVKIEPLPDRRSQDRESSHSRASGSSGGHHHRSHREKSPSHSAFGPEPEEDFNLPVSVAIAFIFIYMFFGAFMYTLWEDWTYLESFYFVFITASTIGYGDVLPKHPNFFLLTCVYTFLGLALVSMTINVIMEFMAETINRAKEKVGEAKELAKEKMDQAKAKALVAKDKLHEAGSRAIDRVDRAKEKVTRKISKSTESTPSPEEAKRDHKKRKVSSVDRASSEEPDISPVGEDHGKVGHTNTIGASVPAAGTKRDVLI